MTYPPHPMYTPKPKKRKWPWFLLGAFLLFAVFGAIIGGDSTPTTPGAVAATADAGSLVVYEVLGKGTAGNVTYSKEGFAQEQHTSVRLPWRKELRFADRVGVFSPLSLVAQNGAQGGSITCRVLVDGEVVGESTSSGQYAVVTCNGNG